MLNKLEDVTRVDLAVEEVDAGYHPEDGPGLPYGSNNRTSTNFCVMAETPDGFRFLNREVFSEGLHIESDERGDPHWA